MVGHVKQSYVVCIDPVVYECHGLISKLQGKLIAPREQPSLGVQPSLAMPLLAVSPGEPKFSLQTLNFIYYII